jgi:hypothetical protein
LLLKMLAYTLQLAQLQIVVKAWLELLARLPLPNLDWMLVRRKLNDLMSD